MFIIPNLKKEIMSTKKEVKENRLPLEKIFHTSSAKVLDFLILNKKFDYSLNDISRATDVDNRTLQRIFPILLEEKLVIKTRSSGKSFMYVFNRESERGKALEKFFEETNKQNLGILQSELKKKTHEKYVECNPAERI